MSPTRIESPRGYERHLAVETPEHVLLDFELAGVGSRAAALVLDTLVVLFLALAATLGAGAIGLLRVLPPGWVAAVSVAALFATVWGYYVLCEGLWGGRTVGKRYVGVRVVMDTGHPLTFAAAAVRNLLRLLDMQPAPTYVVGALFVFFHPEHRRLGDLVAGTVVVRDHPELRSLGAGTAPEPDVLFAGPPLLDDAEFRLVAQFQQRRVELDPARRHRIGAKLSSRFAARYPARPSDGEPFLDWLVAEEGRRRQRPGRATAADRLVARNRAKWEEFKALARRAERAGVTTMGGAEITSFAAAYREVAADLARARTYGVDRGVVTYLERVVSAGHNALYGLAGVRRLPLGRLVLRELPAAVVGARGYVLVAALIFALPAVASYLLIRERPAIAAEVLPDEMIARAEEGPANRASGAGYAEYPSPYLPLVASRIVANNVQVAFGAFAFGITAGIGTVLVLGFNGLSFGAVVGLFTNKGLAGWLLTFVAGHGVLELAAIFIAGGAGLLVARALVAPGDLTRRDALVLFGRQAIRLVGAATCLLLLAGTIEGFLSASAAPAAVKLGVSGASVALLALGYVNGRRWSRANAGSGVAKP